MRTELDRHFRGSVNSDLAPVLLPSISLLDVHELVLNVGSIVGSVDRRDLLRALLNLGPAVHLEAQMLLDNIGVSIAESDRLPFLDEVELLVEGHQLDTPILIADHNLGYTVHSTAVVPSTLTCDRDGANLQVHVDSSTWLKLRHSDENRFAKGGFLG